MKLGIFLCIALVHTDILIALQSTSPLENPDLLEQFAQRRRREEQLKHDRTIVSTFVKNIRTAWVSAQALTSKHALAHRLLNYAYHTAIVQEWRELNQRVILYEQYRQELLQGVIDNQAKKQLETTAAEGIRLLATELESNREKVHTEPKRLLHTDTQNMRATPSRTIKLVCEKKPLPNPGCELEASLPEHLPNDLLHWELVSQELQGMCK